MIGIKRKFAIESFLENTSIHGVSYINSRGKIEKIMFICLIAVSLFFVLTTTLYYLMQYLEYESSIIREENEKTSFDPLPVIMICPTDKISLLKSIIDLQPEFNKIYDFIDRDSSLTDSLDLKSSIKKYKMQNLSSVNQKIDPVFVNDLKRRNRYSLKKCDIETQGEIIDCTKAEQYNVYNFNGFCLLHDLAKLNLNQSSLEKVKNLLNYGEENKFKININMNPITRFDDNLFIFTF